MKSTLAAFATLVVGVVLGWLLVGLLGLKGASGRDLTPLIAVAAFTLFFSGLTFSLLWLGRLRDCLGGVACYSALVGFLVVFFSGGLAFFEFFLSWLSLVLIATLVPWGLGVLVGRWARRLQTA